MTKGVLDGKAEGSRLAKREKGMALPACELELQGAVTVGTPWEAEFGSFAGKCVT